MKKQHTLQELRDMRETLLKSADAHALKAGPWTANDAALLDSYALELAQLDQRIEFVEKRS